MRLAKPRGLLFAIGGGEDKEGDCTILTEFVRMAGGEKSRIVVMTAATDEPEEAGAEYLKVFKRLGAKSTRMVDVSTRQDASDAESLAVLEQATGVFFTGGDQLHVTSLIGGRGSYVDIDTVEQDLPKWLRFYLDNGGPPARLTASSDASINSPRSLFEQIRSCTLEYNFPLEQTLRLVTTNTAAVLQLANKGQLEVGRDADALVLRKGSLEIKDVIAQGRCLVRAGQLAFSENFLSESNRVIRLAGKL